MFEVRCPKCATLLSAEKVPLGSKVGCKKCGQIFVLDASVEKTTAFGPSTVGKRTADRAPATVGVSAADPATNDVLILTDDRAEAFAAGSAGRAFDRTSPHSAEGCQRNHRSSCCPIGRGLLIVVLLSAVFVGLTSLSRMCGRGGCPFSQRGNSSCVERYVTPVPGEPSRCWKGVNENVAEILASCSMVTHGNTLHTEPVRSVALSASSKWVVSGALDGQIRVWLRDNGKFVSAVQSGHHSPNSLQSVLFTDPDTVVSAGGRDVRFWTLNPKTGMLRLVGSQNLGNGVLAVSAHPSGSWLAVALSDGSIRVIRTKPSEHEDLPDASFTQTLANAHGGKTVRALAFHPNGQMLASAGEDSTVRYWSVVSNTGDGLQLAKTPTHISKHETPVDALAFDRAGKLVLAGDRSGLVKVRSVQDHRTLGVLLAMTDSPVHSLALLPDGHAFGGLGDGSLVAWKLPNLTNHSIDTPAAGTPASVATVAPIGPAVLAHAGGLTSLTVSSNNGETLVTGGADQNVRIWSLPRLLTALSRVPLGVKHGKLAVLESGCCVDD